MAHAAAFMGRGLVRGRGCGPLVVSEEPISFYGGVDPSTGMIVEKGHELYGRVIAGTILVFPYGKGSTVGSYTLLRLARRGKAPAGIVNMESEPIVVTGCLLGGIPLMDNPHPNPFELKRVLSGLKAELLVEEGSGLLRVVSVVRGEEEGA